MTVSAQTPINRSTGNGATTVFPYTFKIISEADIEVSVDDVVKTLNVDYTVTGVGSDSGGNVTMAVAPASLTTVVRRRNMAIVRSTDYQDQGELPAATLDADIDATVLMIQQVDEQIGRALALPASASGVSAELPAPVANTFLGWNALGTALQNFAGAASVAVSTFMATVVSAVDAAAARLALGAAKSGANADITSMTGNLTGIKFAPSQTLSADVNTLDDYEEGTWTPAFTAQVGAITSYTSSGTYTKVGRLVVCQFVIGITAVGTGSSAGQISNLPFAVVNASAAGSGRENATTGKMLNIWPISGTVVNVANYDGTTALATGASLIGTFTYYAA